MNSWQQVSGEANDLPDTFEVLFNSSQNANLFNNTPSAFTNIFQAIEDTTPIKSIALTELHITTSDPPPPPPTLVSWRLIVDPVEAVTSVWNRDIYLGVTDAVTEAPQTEYKLFNLANNLTPGTYELPTPPPDVPIASIDWGLIFTYFESPTYNVWSQFEISDRSPNLSPTAFSLSTFLGQVAAGSGAPLVCLAWDFPDEVMDNFSVSHTNNTTTTNYLTLAGGVWWSLNQSLADQAVLRAFYTASGGTLDPLKFYYGTLVTQGSAVSSSNVTIQTTDSDGGLALHTVALTSGLNGMTTSRYAGPSRPWLAAATICPVLGPVANDDPAVDSILWPDSSFWGVRTSWAYEPGNNVLGEAQPPAERSFQAQENSLMQFVGSALASSGPFGVVVNENRLRFLNKFSFFSARKRKIGGYFPLFQQPTAYTGTSLFYLQILSPILRNDYFAGGFGAPILKLLYFDPNTLPISVSVPFNSLKWRYVNQNTIRQISFEIFDGAGQIHPLLETDVTVALTCRCTR